jgi:hypothetical protein
MGYKLRRWLADRLPDSLTSGERLVALEIADQAHEDTRLAYGADLIPAVLRRTGFGNAKQLGKVWEKLNSRGIELRVPIKGADGGPLTGKDGRVIYAMRGHSITFRVPTEAECPALKVPPQGDLTPPETALDDPERSPHRGTNEAERSPQGETKDRERSPHRGRKVPPQGDPTTHTTQQTTTAVADAPAEEPSAEPPAKRATGKHEAADELTNGFWEKHGKGRAQSYIAIRGIVRKAMSNGVERNDLAHALDAIAREGKPISGGTIDYALGQRRQQQQRGGARADIATYEDYESGNVKVIL